MTMTLQDHLKKWFGYNEFRPYQQEIVEGVLSGRDVVAILPTGAGKSICYQLPAMIFSGTAIVISPLISLMQDQVQALIKSGVPAAYINSSLPPPEMYELMRNLSQFKLLYIAPERFADPSFVDRLKAIDLSFFVIDEAHCISQWGHSFRPDYRQLSLIKETFPNKPMMALTATATFDVEKDIIDQLAIKTPQIVKGSFDRPNLTIRIKRKNEPVTEILSYINKNPNISGIVYASTRKNVDLVYERLKQKGINVGRYHAGLSDPERTASLHDFIHDKITVMVATVAFGMGINKPDIRYIIHHDMPRTIEQYYQEIGRAGRDGLPADCLMFFDMQDLFVYNSFLKDVTDPVLYKQMKNKTDRMFSLCNSPDCRRVLLLKYFGERYPSSQCTACDNCVDDEEKMEGTIIAQKILSCVKRLSESFGIKHVVDVLRGSKSANVLSRNHDSLSTYNLMGDCTEQEVRYYIDCLLSLNLLRIAEGEYPILQWTEASLPVIQGKVKVEFRKKIFKEERKAKNRIEEKNSSDITPHNAELFELLRALRSDIAKEAEIPPFGVFTDRALYEMAAYYPVKDSNFLLINGVGRFKLDAYGAQFMETIRKFCSESGIEPVKGSSMGFEKKERKERDLSVITPTVHQTVELFRRGMSIEQMAEERSLSHASIYMHLGQAIQGGLEININPLVSLERQAAINAVIDKVGVKALSPIKKALPEEFSYSEIGLVVAMRKK